MPIWEEAFRRHFHDLSRVAAESLWLYSRRDSQNFPIFCIHSTFICFQLCSSSSFPVPINHPSFFKKTCRSSGLARKGSSCPLLRRPGAPATFQTIRWSQLVQHERYYTLLKRVGELFPGKSKTTRNLDFAETAAFTVNLVTEHENAVWINLFFLFFSSDPSIDSLPKAHAKGYIDHILME